MRISIRQNVTFTIANTTAQVHWSVLLWLPFCLHSAQSAVGGVLAFTSILVLLLVHELGHAAFAEWCGLRVYGLDINALRGRCRCATPRHALEHSIVAWGSVAGQFGLFISFSFGFYFSTREMRDIAAPIFIVFTAYNLFLIAANLVPLCASDGKFAWRLVPALFNGQFARYWHQNARRRLNTGGRRP